MFDDMDHIDNDAVPQALATRQEGAEALRFHFCMSVFASFQNDTFRNMMWLDPQFWTDDRDYGKDSINGLLCMILKPPWKTLVSTGAKFSLNGKAQSSRSRGFTATWTLGKCGKECFSTEERNFRIC